MNDRYIRRHDMFGRVLTFGNQNAADFASGSDAKQHLARLSGIVDKIMKAKAGQQKESNTPRAVLLDALRLDVKNTTRLAKAIDQDEPGFADKFRAPKSSSDQDLITAADAIIARLVIDPEKDSPSVQAEKTALVARFVAKECDPNFAQNLADDRAAIDEAEDNQEKEREKGVGNTAHLDELIREGMKEVTYLDAIMHVKYARNAEKIRMWLSASHIERAPKREKKTDANAAKTGSPPVPAQ